jgi:hypothetical protein
MMKEISRNYGYILINSVLTMLFQLSPCFENDLEVLHSVYTGMNTFSVLL